MQKREIYNDINKYDVPVFEIGSETINGKELNTFVPSSCLIYNSFDNITVNDNCFQFLRRVSLAKTNSQLAKLGDNYDITNPYFSTNIPENEYHLCSLYLKPGFYNNVSEVVAAMNDAIFNTSDNLFRNSKTARTITTNGLYKGSFGSADVNLEDANVIQATVSQPSTAVGSYPTKTNALATLNAMNSYQAALGIYRFINSPGANISGNSFIEYIPANVILIPENGGYYDSYTDAFRFTIGNLGESSVSSVRVQITSYGCSMGRGMESKTFVLDVSSMNVGDEKTIASSSINDNLNVEFRIIKEAEARFWIEYILTAPSSTTIDGYGLYIGSMDISFKFYDSAGNQFTNVSKTRAISNPPPELKNICVINNMNGLQTFLNSTNLGTSGFDGNYQNTYNFYSLFSTPSIKTLPSGINSVGDVPATVLGSSTTVSAALIQDRNIEIANAFIPQLIESKSFLPVKKTANTGNVEIADVANIAIGTTAVDARCQGLVYSIIYDAAVAFINYVGKAFTDETAHLEFMENFTKTGEQLEVFFRNMAADIDARFNALTGNSDDTYAGTLMLNFFTSFYKDFNDTDSMINFKEIRRIFDIFGVYYRWNGTTLTIITPEDLSLYPVYIFKNYDFGDMLDTASMMIATLEGKTLLISDVKTVINHGDELDETSFLPSDLTPYFANYQQEENAGKIRQWLEFLTTEPGTVHYKFVQSNTSSVGYIDANGKSYGEDEYDIVLNSEIYNQLFPSNTLSDARLTALDIETAKITNSNLFVYPTGFIVPVADNELISGTGGNIASFKLASDLQLTNGGVLVKGSKWELRDKPYDPNGYYNVSTAYSPVVISGNTSLTTARTTVPPVGSFTLIGGTTQKIAGNAELLNDTFYQRLFLMNRNDETQPFSVDSYGNIVCNIAEIIPVHVGMSTSKGVIYKKIISNYDSTSAFYFPDLVSYTPGTRSYEPKSDAYLLQKYVLANERVNQNFSKFRKNEVSLWTRIGMLCHKIEKQDMFYKFAKDAQFTDEIYNGDLVINADICDVSSLTRLDKGYTIPNASTFVYNKILFSPTVPKVGNFALTIPASLKFKLQITENIEEIINSLEGNDFNNGIHEAKVENDANQKLIEFSNLKKISIPDGKKIYLYITDYQQPYSLRNGSFKLIINYI